MCIYPCNTYSKVVWRRIYTSFLFFYNGYFIEIIRDVCAFMCSSQSCNPGNLAIQQSSNPAIQQSSGQITSLGSQGSPRSQYFHTFFIFLQRFSFFCLSISSKLYTTGIVPRVHRSSSVAYQTGVIGDWKVGNQHSN